MRAIDLFDRCRNRGKEIKAVEDAIESLEKSMMSCASGIGQTVRGALGDRYASYVARKERLEKEMRLLKRLRATEQVAVILLTDQYPDARREAVRLYYGRARSADQIAIYLNYSVRHIERMLGEIREKLAQVPDGQADSVVPGWYRELGEKEGWA